MNNPSFPALVGIALVSLSNPAFSATVVSNVTEPTGFFADASVELPDPIPGNLNRYRTSATVGFTGSSFIHDDGSTDSWLLTSIGVRAHADGINTNNESLAGLTLRIFEGSAPIAGSTQLGSDITFGTGTFDASNENFLNFNLTSAETAAIGLLSQGTLYSFTVTGGDGTDIRLSRLASDAEASFAPYFDGAERPNGAAQAEEFVFYISGTTIPEPSTGLLSILSLGTLLLSRRR